MRWFLTVFAAVLLCAVPMSCGGGASSTHTTGPGVGTDASAHSKPQSEIAKGGESDSLPLDLDKDKDNPSLGYYDRDDDVVRYYGHAAASAERRQVANVMRRYYRAALAGDGKAACALMDPVFAELLGEEGGQKFGRPVPRGVTCATVAERIFAERRKQLRVEQPTLRVTALRVRDNRGWALLQFGHSAPPGVILVNRVKGAWVLSEVARNEMP